MGVVGNTACRSAAALLLVGATGAGAVPGELPPQLRGRIEIKVVSCEPAPGGDRLMRAEVELRTGSTEVEIGDLQCGAFRRGSDRALFLNPVPAPRRLPPDSLEQLVAYFPFDARHEECRCTVNEVRSVVADAPLREPGEPEALELTELLHRWSLRAASEAAPLSEGALRRERLLAPSVTLRAGPGAQHPSLAELGTGGSVDVLGVRGGWKWVRVPTSRVQGWIPDDASTSDLVAPERVAAVLGVLRAAQGGQDLAGAEPPGPICSAISPGDLRDLVFAFLPELHAVYVTSLWHSLAEPDRNAFQRFATECYGVTRIVDLASGEELRNVTWGD